MPAAGSSICAIHYEISDWVSGPEHLALGDGSLYDGWLRVEDVIGGRAPEPEAGEAPFSDVLGHWALEAIRFAQDSGLMDGVGGGLFDPEGTLNRAMLVTMLWRMEGKSTAGGGSPFSDVPDGEWYSAAVAWAAASGVAKGVGGGAFAPLETVTREQTAVMLMRYAEHRGRDVSRMSGLGGFADAGGISDWALAAMKWANAEGLIMGSTATLLKPGDGATCAEAAVIFMRLNNTLFSNIFIEKRVLLYPEVLMFMLTRMLLLRLDRSTAIVSVVFYVVY